MIRLHQLSSIDPTTGSPLPSGSSLVANGSGGFAVSDTVLDQHTTFFQQLTIDMDAVNRSSPTSALASALDQGLINLADALGQGALDLPNIL